MQEFLLKWLAVAFATLLGSSLLSMMAVFSGSTGGDLDALLHLQAAAIPLAAVAVAWSLHVIARSPGTVGVSRRLWAELPGWLVFVVVVMLSLVLVAELAFVLVSRYTEEPQRWRDHVPVATAFATAMGLAACYAARRTALR